MACVWSHSFKEKDCPELLKKGLNLELSDSYRSPKPKACACGEHLGCVWESHGFPESHCPELTKKTGGTVK